MKRVALLLCLFACSGNDATVDGGADAGGADVTPEYYVKETAPPTPVIVDVVAGAEHTCTLVAYGEQQTTYCFGADAALGGTKNGILAVASAGLATSASPKFLQIASSHGANHTCAIDDQKQVFCWGDNTLSQCATGNTNAVPTPTLAYDFQNGIIQASSLALGSTSSCAIRSTGGKLACWGDNGKCQTDLWDQSGCLAGVMAAVDTTDSDVVFKNVTVASLGAIHGCVAADPAGGGSGALFCFGDDGSLETAPPGNAITAPAAKTTTTERPISIAAGDAHTCFVTDSPHELFCFGKNDQHQASPTSSSPTIDPSAMTPIAMPKTGLPTMVFARAAETCVVDTDGILFCFGAGHGTNIDEITGVKDVGRVAMGGAHTCILGHLPSDSISAPGSLICWGDNTNGQAGQTAGGSITTPTAVVIPASAPAQ